MKRRIKKSIIPFALLVSTIGGSYAKLPNMEIQFGGPLNNNCSFVKNADVVNSLRTTMEVLNGIQQVEQQCQSSLTNSRAFIQSSLNNALEMQTKLRTAITNESVIQDLINKQIASGIEYDGTYDTELLVAQQEIKLLKDKDFIGDLNLASTMQLGITVFNDLKNSPPACSLSFGKDILSPAIAVTGQMFSPAAPGISLVAGLFSAMIEYGSKISNTSYQSLRSLNNAKNFHMTYKCSMKNIQTTLCKLYDAESAIASAQSENEEDEFLYKYMLKVQSYDNDSKDYKKYFHLNRHRYRISKILEDLYNIYSSPETAQDLEKSVSFQTSFTSLALMPRLNPLKNTVYKRLMVEAGYAEESQISANWTSWDNNQVVWTRWVSSFHGDSFNQRAKNLCKNIDLQKYPLLKGIYNSNNNDCSFMSLTKNEVITQFIEAVIAPVLVEVQGEIIRLNNKIKTNANIHALYTNIRNQDQNTGNIDYEEYNLEELLTLYKEHALMNKTSSLQLYSADLIQIMDAIEPLINSENLINKSFDSFNTAAKEAYAKLATISNNGVEGGIFYKQLVESKISAYLDGVKNNYIFHKNKDIAQAFVNFNFHAGNLDRFAKSNDVIASSGSSDIALMMDVKKSFVRTFGNSINTTMKRNISLYSKDKSLKRELIHSCAIFYPQMIRSEYPGRTKSIRRFCKNLLTKENGLFLSSNSKEKFPAKLSGGQTFSSDCYYKKYEGAAKIFRINKAKRNRGRFRI